MKGKLQRLSVASPVGIRRALEGDTCKFAQVNGFVAVRCRTSGSGEQSRCSRQVATARVCMRATVSAECTAVDSVSAKPMMVGNKVCWS